MYDRCRHLRINGGRCNAMALNGKAFCYFHMHNRRKPSTKPAQSNTVDYGSIPVNAPVAPTPLHLEVPLLEDRTAIQVSITRIVLALAANEIDPKRAGLLLYALQIASSNLRHDLTVDPEDMPAVVLTTSGDEIAPAETVFEDEDLKGHKKSCNCDKCEFVQADSETHHADCSCGECPPSQGEAGKTVTEEPQEEAGEIVNLNASAGDDSIAIQSNRHPERARRSRGTCGSRPSARKGCPILSGAKGGKRNYIPAEPTNRSSLENIPRSDRHSKALAL
jgi:hypothetical protein